MRGHIWLLSRQDPKRITSSIKVLMWGTNLTSTKRLRNSRNKAFRISMVLLCGISFKRKNGTVWWLRKIISPGLPVLLRVPASTRAGLKPVKGKLSPICHEWNKLGISIFNMWGIWRKTGQQLSKSNKMPNSKERCPNPDIRIIFKT